MAPAPNTVTLGNRASIYEFSMDTIEPIAIDSIQVYILATITIMIWIISSVQSLRHVQLFETPWIAAHQASLSITNSQSLLTHVHQVGDAIQPFHSLSSPCSSPKPSQHQGLFQWVNSLHEVVKVLEFQLQHQSLQWTPRTELL